MNPTNPITPEPCISIDKRTISVDHGSGLVFVTFHSYRRGETLRFEPRDLVRWKMRRWAQARAVLPCSTPAAVCTR